jgi:hypothetical protein
LTTNCEADWSIVTNPILEAEANPGQEEPSVRLLLHMHTASVTEITSAMSAMQGVIYWIIASAAGLGAVAGLLATSDSAEAKRLAYLGFSATWLCLVALGAGMYLCEVGRMLRSKWWARQLECRLIKAYPQVDYSIFVNHAVHLGVTRRDGRLGGVNLDFPYMFAVVPVFLVAFFVPVWAVWNLPGLLDITASATWQWLYTVAVASVLLVIIRFAQVIHRAHKPECLDDCRYFEGYKRRDAVRRFAHNATPGPWRKGSESYYKPPPLASPAHDESPKATP